MLIIYTYTHIYNDGRQHYTIYYSNLASFEIAYDPKYYVIIKSNGVCNVIVLTINWTKDEHTHTHTHIYIYYTR